ncbi:uncharacterized protein LOC122824678 [Gambusia affinis]|uniref:uncharacterized protein LOC122824678 n=1 Tax=Gambusia affinis TaxID=33528 RepID=UPI001CDB4E0D|nr:uncharacterized protein LOC122824678 [Gambusia affinis]
MLCLKQKAVFTQLRKRIGERNPSEEGNVFVFSESRAVDHSSQNLPTTKQIPSNSKSTLQFNGGSVRWTGPGATGPLLAAAVAADSLSWPARLRGGALPHYLSPETGKNKTLSPLNIFPVTARRKQAQVVVMDPECAAISKHRLWRTQFYEDILVCEGFVFIKYICNGHPIPESPPPPTGVNSHPHPPSFPPSLDNLPPHLASPSCCSSKKEPQLPHHPLVKSSLPLPRLPCSHHSAPVRIPLRGDKDLTI